MNPLTGRHVGGLGLVERAFVFVEAGCTQRALSAYGMRRLLWHPALFRDEAAAIATTGVMVCGLSVSQLGANLRQSDHGLGPL